MSVVPGGTRPSLKSNDIFGLLMVIGGTTLRTAWRLSSVPPGPTTCTLNVAPSSAEVVAGGVLMALVAPAMAGLFFDHKEGWPMGLLTAAGEVAVPPVKTAAA